MKVVGISPRKIFPKIVSPPPAIFSLTIDQLASFPVLHHSCGGGLGTRLADRSSKKRWRVVGILSSGKSCVVRYPLLSFTKTNRLLILKSACFYDKCSDEESRLLSVLMLIISFPVCSLQGYQPPGSHTLPGDP